MSKQSLTSKTMHAIKWNYVSTMLQAVLQIVYTAVMARFLSPGDFGLVALSMLILKFGGYFAKMGVSQAIIQKKELYKEDIRAAFTISLFLGITFLLFFLFFAPLSIYMLEEKDRNEVVIPIIRVMSLTLSLEILFSTAISLLRREFKFRQIAIINVIAVVTSYVFVGMLLAWLKFGVWSLVFASLTQVFLKGILAYVWTRHSIVLTWEKKHYQAILAFGSKVSLISFLEFIGSEVDKIIISRLLGKAQLGFYDRGAMLINLPKHYLTMGISSVLLPSLSKIQSDIPRLRKVYITSVMLMGYVLFPICLGIAAAAEPIVLVMLGDQWKASIDVLRILALAAPFIFITNFSGVLCDATATLNIKMVLQVVYIGFLSLLFYLLHPFGLAGIATAMLIGAVSRNIAYLFVVKSIVHYQWNDLFYTFKSGGFTGMLTAGAIYGVVYSFNLLHIPVLITLGVSMGIGGICFLGGLLLPFNAKTRRELVQKIEKIVPQKKTGIGKILSVYIQLLKK